MATPPKVMAPPPPPFASNDPIFNRWLHDINVIVAKVDANQAQTNTNTANIATNTTNIASNAANIATNSANIAVNTSNIATHTSQIASLAARSQVLNGGGAPAAGLGANGDWYADTTGHHIHVKVGGAWVQIV